MHNLYNQLVQGAKATGLAALIALTSQAATAQTIYALDDNKLMVLPVSNVRNNNGGTLLSGIIAGQKIVGIDSRPATGGLYGLGYNYSTGAANLYLINPATFSVAVIGSAVTLDLGSSYGYRFDHGIGFDFNPVVDRIRVVGRNTGANYRLNPNDGSIVARDADLSYAPGTSGAGLTPRVSAVAYSNSQSGGSTSTTLAALDAVNLKSSVVPAPNTGVLVPLEPMPPAVRYFNQITDFDIYYNPATGQDEAYYTTFNGQDVELSKFGIGDTEVHIIGFFDYGRNVADIALKIEAPVNQPLIGKLVYALSKQNELLTFDSQNPLIIRSSVPVTGIPAGQIILGFDVRPATGQIYALSGNPIRKIARLHTIDALTGVATPVSTADIALDPGVARNVGFDFNPVADAIRIVSTNNRNWRLSPVTGQLLGTDVDLAYQAGDVNFGRNPAVGGVAYTNSYGGATATALYGYDDSTNSLVQQAPPNSGQLSRKGFSGIYFSTLDGGVDLDVLSDGVGGNVLYASGEPHSGGGARFYTVSTETGRFSLVGSIGVNLKIREVAFAVDATPKVDQQTLATGSKKSFSLYPNPAGSASRVHLDMVLSADQAYSVIISDRFGKQVQNVELAQAVGGEAPSMDISALDKGVYMVQVMAGGKVVQQSRLLK